MTNMKQDVTSGYRFSSRAVIVFGGLCTLLGLGLAIPIPLFGFLLLLLGLPVLISGLIREHRELKAARQ